MRPTRRCSEKPRGLWVEANLCHVKQVVRALGLEGASPATKVKIKVEREGSVDPELGLEETTMFHTFSARLNCLSQDGPHITFATQKLCSKMSRPEGTRPEEHEEGWFFIGKQRTECLFEWQGNPNAPPLLTQTGQDTDSQGSRSVDACT